MRKDYTLFNCLTDELSDIRTNMNRRQRQVRSILGLLLLVIGSGQQLSAQDTPLDFVDKYRRIGLEVGFSSVFQSGTYVAGCGLFEAGSNANFVIAAAFDQNISKLLQFEALLGFQTRSIESHYTSREAIGIATQSGPVNAEVDFENIGRLNLSSIFVQPSLKAYPLKNVYVGVGPSVNFNIGGSTQYEKNIVSKTIMLNELGLSEVYYSEQESSDPYSKVFAPEDRSDVAPVTLDAVISVGAEFKLGRAMSSNPVNPTLQRALSLGPRIQYVIPLTNTMSDGEHALKLGSFQFLIGMRYVIGSFR